MKSLYYIMRLFMICLCVLLLPSCEDEASDTDYIQMPVFITIPAGDGEMRSPGDPGESVTFPLPKFAKIYVVSPLGVTAHETELFHEFWSREGNLYHYQGNLHIQILSKLTEGRVYVALSRERLKVSLEHPTTKREVENLTFSLKDNVGLSLKDLYSNPVNDFNTQTNGTIVHDGKILRTRVLCYHVASKIDVMWNINPVKQDMYEIEEIKLTHVSQVGCLFKPTTGNQENTEKSEQIIVGKGGIPITPSNRWNGRAVVYALQRQGGILDWQLSYTDRGVNPPKVVVKNAENRPAVVDPAFTSWYRINARIGFHTGS